jgi:putative alpha-1,2-mannosidase
VRSRRRSARPAATASSRATPAALVQALGGRATARHRLDQFFAQLNAGPTSAYAFLGNEPTLHTPYLYDYVGAPARAAQVVRRAWYSLYGPGPGGMPGNDDLGAMSSWVVWSALGFYPIVPGTDVLAVGAPMFPHVTLHVGARTVHVDATGAPDRSYVAGVRVDGVAQQATWLHASDLARAGRVTFTMSTRPTRWGTALHDAPPSGLAATAPCAQRATPASPRASHPTAA